MLHKQLKECATCLKCLPDTEFYKSPRYRCKECHRAYVCAWQARNREAVNASKRRYAKRKKDEATNEDIHRFAEYLYYAHKCPQKYRFKLYGIK